MTRQSRTWHALLYPALWVAGLALLFPTVAMMGFAIRDSFCYPDHVDRLIVLGAVLGALCAVSQIPAFFVARKALGSGKWTTYAAALPPLTLSCAALLGTLADIVKRLANAAVCAAGPPELQDTLVMETAISNSLGQVSYGFFWIGLAALPVLTVVLFVTALRNQTA